MREDSARIKNYFNTSAICVALAMIGGTAQAAISYVDVTDGVSGNTMTYSNGAWRAWTAFNGQTMVVNDAVWDKRAFGNSATIYQNAAASQVDTNATRLRTTVTVPAPGLSGYYNVYVLFWTDSSTTWRVGAALADYAGQLPIFAQSTPGVTRFWASGTDTNTVFSTSLAPNPFATSVMISESNRRLLMTPVLGQVFGSNISVYMEPDRLQSGSDLRTWIDGIGYELITNKILSVSMAGSGNVIINFIGAAGRQYAEEWTGSLDPPVTWIPLQTGTANSSGLVSFTNTPYGSPEFYRIHDVTPPPAPPANLKATAGVNSVALSWATSTGATTYNAKSATSSGGPYTTITNVTATNFVNTGLSNGTPYYYVVSTLNFNGESGNSAEANATPFPPQPPAAPTGLAATPGNNLVVLSWTASAGAGSYNVKSATNSGGPYTTNANVTGTSFVNSGLSNGVTYYYVISALNIYGESANSSETNATPAPVPPFIPTGLTLIASNAQVSLSWTASPGATSYNVKSATNNGGPYTTVTNVTATNFIDTGLSNGTTYYYVVSALNDYGESADSLQRSTTPFPTPALVYPVEFTGTNFPAPPLPTLGNLPVIQPLPDPFAWANDPLNTNATRSTSFYDWAHHRAEIKAQVENYEIGTKPFVDQTNIFASYSGTTLTVRVTNIVAGVPKTLTLTCAVSLPAGSGPFPAIIGMNSPNGSVNSSLLASVAKVTFSHNQVTVYGNPQNTDPFFQLYPGQNTSNTGQYAAWAWGVSRIIDGLYKLNGALGAAQIDLNHIGVTGCSYAGKMALFAGAFDERIALTIPQESGGGGVNSWRYNHTEPGGTVEDIDNTDYNWFMDSLHNFAGDNVSRLPEDHHMLCAMVAPRALFATGNPDYTWLGNPSCYVSCRAVERIYGTFGISDRFGFNIIGGHSHCATTSGIDSEMGAFINKFLLGQTNVNTLIRDYPGSYSSINYSSWTAWWGTTNAVFGP
jgi:fibronectin type 3 domain-containing protein